MLTNTQIRNAKPGEKPIRLSDEKGLYLEVAPSGGKWWRFKYRFGGKEKRISLGVYPEISLADARKRRDDAREQVAKGVDPSEAKKALKQVSIDAVANAFEAVAREWFAKHSTNMAASHSSKIIRLLERDIFPLIGKRDIGELKAPDVLQALRKIEDRGALETAHRAKQTCGQVFRYAVATGRAERDPTGDLKGALPAVKHTHMASITDPVQIGGLLRAIDAYKGFYVVRAALKIAPLVFVRPGELRNAHWSEIDLEKAEWNIPAERMKMRIAHLVPLSKQAVAILRDLHPYTSNSLYVFPGMRDLKRPMSDAAIQVALRSMNYTSDQMTGHGFRAMARTVMDEVLGIRPELIEQQLAHTVRDPLGRAYNRTSHLPERKKMMQQWADYLDKLKAGAEVVAFKKVV